jgi:hypothetical protein
MEASKENNTCNPRELLRETQALPSAHELTQEEITREVDAMRQETEPGSPSRGAGAPPDG